jgi:small GTP-binding protein
VQTDEPDFKYDVFLSHSAKDKSVVREIAERLRNDGVKVWFDEWVLKPGDVIPSKVEEGLELSYVLVLCMSASAFGSDWAQLESGTFRFRDPLNKERRFIPLRLDDAPMRGSLAQFLYINWLPAYREPEYAKLLDACRRPIIAEMEAPRAEVAENIHQLELEERIFAYSFNRAGSQALSASPDAQVRLWNVKGGRCLRVFQGHELAVQSVAWSPDERFAVSGSDDKSLRIWNVATEACLRVLRGHEGAVLSAAWSGDSRQILSASYDKTMCVWDAATGDRVGALIGHTANVLVAAWSPDERFIVSGAHDRTLRLWDAKTHECLRVFKGHTDRIHGVAWRADQHQILSAAGDKTLRLWDVRTGNCLRILEGHTLSVRTVAWHTNQRIAVSGAMDSTVRVWNTETGLCFEVLKGRKGPVMDIAWTSDGGRAVSGHDHGGIRVWNFSKFVAESKRSASPVLVSSSTPHQVQYTNAKVLLVGESGAGKTGLSRRLTSNNWQPSDSTVGAWATQWKLPVASDQGIEREIWLWDFGGQADQRLIHQLYMDETALAVLVFDGQKEDLFETLGQWDRDLTRATRKRFAKLLVAGRVDAGGLRISRSEVEKFAAEHNFRDFLETSAKRNLGCEELKQAILNGINWEEIPCRTTEVLFKRLKEEILRLKDDGRVLMRFNELRDALQLRLASEFKRFSDEELRAVLTLLAGPGVVWELAFGSWVLLQPERINAYAQAVIRTMQADEHERGCIMEDRVLNGELAYESSMARLASDEERFVLLAMQQTLVERGLCLRQPTEKGTLLVFPSYYRRERTEMVKFPQVLVSFQFTGFLDEIYATLVVQLHHTRPFQQHQLWRYAADFKTNTGKQLGVKLTRRAAGLGELEVYFDPKVAMEEKIILSKYVHEHLLQHATRVDRLRHYVCPRCGTTVGNRELAMKRLQYWLQRQEAQPAKGSQADVAKEEPPSIICAECEQRVGLWDELEQSFASQHIQQRVRDLQEHCETALNNETKERALVGEIASTVALAGQITREFKISDKGIDMEIEFTDDAQKATGVRLYLQLKAGDSYTRLRKKDGAEIFNIRDGALARHWMAQAFPVLLVVRNSEGELRWMDVRGWLKQASDNGKKPVKQVAFVSERLDVMSVRRWRDKALGKTSG